MTKFGKHPDKDAVDLAAEAARRRSGRRRRVDARRRRTRGRQPDERVRGFGQQLQKQIGQTGIPVYNVANACATGATALRTAIMAVKAGEVDVGLAVGVEKLAGAGLLGGGGRRSPTASSGSPAAGTARSRRPTVASAPTRCPASSPRSAWSTATSTAARASSCSPGSARRTTPTRRSTRSRPTRRSSPLDEIMNDVMIAYPNTRPMCSANCDGAAAAVVVNGAKLKTLSRRAAAARRQGVGVGADHRPVGGGVPGPARTSTRSPATPPRRPTSRRASVPRTSTWSSCTTASPPPSSCTTTT